MRFQARPSLILLTCATLLAVGPSSHGASRWTPQGRVDQQKDNKPTDLPDFQRGSIKIPDPAQEHMKDQMHLPEARRNAPAMPQTDAFTSAAEHGTYLQVYQKFYGPYGEADPVARRERLRKTAQAIEDCLQGNGQLCDESKQKEILTALSQYNYGQELKRMVLTNNTNRERLKTMDGLESDKTWKALNIGSRSRGGTVTKVEGIAPTQDTTLKHRYFQLDDAKVREELNFSPEQIEILGPEFIELYKKQVRAYSGKTGDDRHAARRYKYVSPRENEYIYGEKDDYGPRNGIYNAVEAEQNNPNVRKIVDDHLNTVQAPKAVRPGERDEQGREKVFLEGERGATSGYRDNSTYVLVPKRDAQGKLIDPNAERRELKTDPERYQHLTKNVNEVFRKSYEKKYGGGDGAEGDALNSSGASRSPGSAAGGAGSPGHTHVQLSLDPVKFDEFLDEIWPTGEARKRRLAEPSGQGGANGATRTN